MKFNEEYVHHDLDFFYFNIKIPLLFLNRNNEDNSNDINDILKEKNIYYLPNFEKEFDIFTNPDELDVNDVFVNINEVYKLNYQGITHYAYKGLFFNGLFDIENTIFAYIITDNYLDYLIIDRQFYNKHKRAMNFLSSKLDLPRNPLLLIDNLSSLIQKVNLKSTEQNINYIKDNLKITDDKINYNLL